MAYGLAVGSSWNQSRGDAMWQTTCQLKLNIRRVAGGFGHLLPFPPATVSFDMFTKAYKTPDKGSKGTRKSTRQVKVTFECLGLRAVVKFNPAAPVDALRMWWTNRRTIDLRVDWIKSQRTYSSHVVQPSLFVGLDQLLF